MGFTKDEARAAIRHGFQGKDFGYMLTWLEEQSDKVLKDNPVSAQDGIASVCGALQRIRDREDEERKQNQQAGRLHASTSEYEALVARVQTLDNLMPTLLNSSLRWRDLSERSSRTRSQQARFRSQLMQAWDGKVACGVLFDMDIPEDLITASHVMKVAQAPIAKRMQLDIWSVRNGLFLCKAIQRGFDNSEICFYEDSDGVLRFHLLADYLKDTELASSKRLTDWQKEKLRKYVNNMRFGDLEGRELRVPMKQENQPFRRALAVHAVQARKFAVQNGWTDATWDFPKFGSEDSQMDVVWEWLKNADTEVAPSVAESVSDVVGNGDG